MSLCDLDAGLAETSACAQVRRWNVASPKHAPAPAPEVVPAAGAVAAPSIRPEGEAAANPTALSGAPEVDLVADAAGTAETVAVPPAPAGTAALPLATAAPSPPDGVTDAVAYTGAASEAQGAGIDISEQPLESLQQVRESYEAPVPAADGQQLPPPPTLHQPLPAPPASRTEPDLSVQELPQESASESPASRGPAVTGDDGGGAQSAAEGFVSRAIDLQAVAAIRGDAATAVSVASAAAALRGVAASGQLLGMPSPAATSAVSAAAARSLFPGTPAADGAPRGASPSADGGVPGASHVSAVPLSYGGARLEAGSGASGALPPPPAAPAQAATSGPLSGAEPAGAAGKLRGKRKLPSLGSRPLLPPLPQPDGPSQV